MAYANGYTYKRNISIDNTKVPSTLTNYPLLVNTTHADLKSVANSGHIENGANLDVRFEVGGTQLAHEIEKYTATTGEVIAHVKIPTVSSSVATDVEMYYGKTGVSNEQDLTALWSDYEFVWHANSLVESKGVTLTNTSSTDTAGAIGRGRAFNGSQRVNQASSPAITTSSFTWEVICNPTSTATTQIFQSFSSQTYFRILAGNYNPVTRISGSAPSTASGQAMTAGVNNYLCFTFDGSTRRPYLNGSPGTTGATAGSVELLLGNRTMGGYNGGNTNPFAGMLDEYRMSVTVVRGADWILAQYRNFSSPSTFYTLGSEETYTVPPVGGTGDMLLMF